ncbi:MAG: ArdC family protein [Verrucomicrobiaceae bacterium]|nr:ArdC family protein [Verrucomicrobiaceae bacterium]
MKPDIYEQVTDRIITQLESGVVPWKSPNFSKVGFPRNFATNRAYQGINVFLLGSLRFTSPFCLSFIQAKVLGGYNRKGEHGSLVVKYGTYTKEGRAGGSRGSRDAPLFEGLHRVSCFADRRHRISAAR